MDGVRWSNKKPGNSLGLPLNMKKTYFESMSKHISTFQAEIYTTDTCVFFNLQKNYKGQNITILTSS